MAGKGALNPKTDPVAERPRPRRLNPATNEVPTNEVPTVHRCRGPWRPRNLRRYLGQHSCRAGFAVSRVLSSVEELTLLPSALGPRLRLRGMFRMRTTNIYRLRIDSVLQSALIPFTELVPHFRRNFTPVLAVGIPGIESPVKILRVLCLVSFSIYGSLLAHVIAHLFS